MPHGGRCPARAPNARDWGWHGICTQQLGLIDYPVRGLDEWSPSP